jgi:hypothetical protein
LHPLRAQTHIYTYAIESDSERVATETALGNLSTELELTHPLRLKGGHRALITVPGIEPEATWAAMDRVVPEWRALFLPRSVESR